MPCRHLQREPRRQMPITRNDNLQAAAIVDRFLVRLQSFAVGRQDRHLDLGRKRPTTNRCGTDHVFGPNACPYDRRPRDDQPHMVGGNRRQLLAMVEIPDRPRSRPMRRRPRRPPSWRPGRRISSAAVPALIGSGDGAVRSACSYSVFPRYCCTESGRGGHPPCRPNPRPMTSNGTDNV